MLQNTRCLQFLMACLVVAVVAADDWHYPSPAANGEITEPEHWGGECDLGRRQSPIDLAYGASVRGTYDDFQFHDYDQVIPEAQATNNGHSIQIDVPSPAPTMVMEGGGLPQKFVLDQMHFHWGSEHTVDGRRYPLELHMVHHDARFATLNDALAIKNGVAVLGILFHVSTVANEPMENLLKAVKEVSEIASKSAPIPKAFQADAFLPTNTSTFFRYEGSLTTPTCVESVLWTVFTHSVSISFQQAEQFKHVKTAQGEELVYNYRSLQPLNSRSLVYVAPLLDLSGPGGSGVVHKPSSVAVSLIAIAAIFKWLYN